MDDRNKAVEELKEAYRVFVKKGGRVSHRLHDAIVELGRTARRESDAQEQKQNCKAGVRIRAQGFMCPTCFALRGERCHTLGAVARATRTHRARLDRASSYQRRDQGRKG